MKSPISSLAATLGRCRTYAQPSLVSPAAWQRLLALADRLPAALSSCLHFECRPAAPEGQVDVILGIDESGRELLRGDNPALSLTNEVRRHPVWKRLATLCQSWHSDPRLGSQLNRLWIECDLPDDGAEVPVPRIFLDLNRPPRDAREAALHRRLVIELCERFVGVPSPSSLRAGLDACWRVGDGHYLHSVGLAPDSEHPNYRLCVRCRDFSGLGHVLSAAGAAGTLETLRRQLLAADFPPDGALPSLLDLDLNADRAPAFGLEWSLPSAAAGRPAEQSLTLLRCLEQSGLLSTEALAALHLWPGSNVEQMSHQLWPSLLRRNINHIKIVYDRKGRPEAKIYLRFEHTLYRRQRSPHLSRRTDKALDALDESTGQDRAASRAS